MFLYIVEKEESDDGTGGLTNHYHDGGGLVVIARNVQDAVGMIEAHNAEAPAFPDYLWLRKAKIRNVDADVLLNGYYTVVNDQEPRLWLFPDAGCC